MKIVYVLTAIATTVIIFLYSMINGMTNQIIESTGKEKNLKNNEFTINAYEPVENGQMIDQEKIITIGNEKYWIDINVNQETIQTANNLSKGCNNDEWCEKDRFFRYITDLRYCTNKTGQKSANDVMTLMSGDCDERSQALASLLLAKDYKAILIYTKNHAFVGMHVKDERNLKPQNAKIKIHGQNYYYAETTDPNAYIGADNKIRPKDFIGIYDINEKRLIPLKKAVFERKG